MVDDGAIATILESGVPELLAAYRFGSTVSGGTHRESDVDVAVLARRPIEPAARLELAARIAAVCGRDADVVDLARASTVLRMQVVAHGAPLPVGDPAARTSFEDFVFSDYARLNEERRAILEQIRRDGTVHGR